MLKTSLTLAAILTMAALGDPAKAKAKLGWVPEITVEEMCAEMVAADLDTARQHALLKSHGHHVSVAKE